MSPSPSITRAKDISKPALSRAQHINDPDRTQHIKWSLGSWPNDSLDSILPSRRRVAIPRLDSFYKPLIGATLLATFLRVTITLIEGYRLPGVGSDAFNYYWQGFLNVSNHPYIDPGSFLFHGKSIPDASYPPLTAFLESVADLCRLQTFFEHQILWCLIGSSTVSVIGIIARDIGGNRAGIFAAFTAAIYPGLWINDPLVLSETPTQLLVAIAILISFRYLRRPRGPLAFGIGVVIGLASLTRADRPLLWPLLVIPTILTAKISHLRSIERKRRSRIGMLAIAITGFMIVISPWAVRNLLTFRNPEIISTTLGRTLIGANCTTTYYGPLIGSWVYACLTVPPTGDPSQHDAFHRHQAVSYALHHKSRWPAVLYARLGRTWGFYSPSNNLLVDAYDNGRGIWPSAAGLIAYWILAPSAIFGALMLRKRRIPTFPLMAPFISVTVVSIFIYGNTRFRAIAEPSIVILASLAEAGWRISKGRKQEALLNGRDLGFASKISKFCRWIADVPSDNQFEGGDSVESQYGKLEKNAG